MKKIQSIVLKMSLLLFFWPALQHLILIVTAFSCSKNCTSEGCTMMHMAEECKEIGL